MRIIIAGGRNFRDYELMKFKMDKILSNVNEPIEIVSGGQCSKDVDTGELYGADYLGEQYANEKGYSLMRFPAKWKLHGKAAGMIRNGQMAKYATHLVAFWDGESKGTENMISLARKHNLNIRVVRYD